ncbi:MAG: alpha/beta hydrolase [Ectothiorhodospiraceae bacterium]|jgi:pimeloyl-ACP methyl ester carboxylesterase
MSLLNINGATLEFRETGRGEPLLFVHGSASDWRTWQRQMEHFGRQYRVMAYSRRYHWPNTPIPEGADYAMEAHVDDLRALIAALGIGPLHLVGHSYGAFVALLAAMRQPDTVRSLVLAEPPAITLFVSDPPVPRELVRLLLTRPRVASSILRFALGGVRPATAAARQGNLHAAMDAMGRAVLRRDYFNRLSPSRREQVYDNAIAAELLGSGFPTVNCDEVSRLQIPTLLLCGEYSPRLFHHIADRLESLLPRVERAAIPAASHLVHEDDPVAYNAKVEAFLKRWTGIPPAK